jgi:hypothetical protein
MCAVARRRDTTWAVVSGNTLENEIVAASEPAICEVRDVSRERVRQPTSICIAPLSACTRMSGTVEANVHVIGRPVAGGQ